MKNKRQLKVSKKGKENKRGRKKQAREIKKEKKSKEILRKIEAKGRKGIERKGEGMSKKEKWRNIRKHESG